MQSVNGFAHRGPSRANPGALYPRDLTERPYSDVRCPLIWSIRYVGHVQILKLHTGENSKVMARYRVMALPTVLPSLRAASSASSPAAPSQ